MTQYALMPENPHLTTRQVMRLDDGALIPEDPDNVDWQAVLAWLDEGNTMPEAPPDILTNPEYRRG
jgi:hypothetical protein